MKRLKTLGSAVRLNIWQVSAVVLSTLVCGAASAKERPMFEGRYDPQIQAAMEMDIEPLAQPDKPASVLVYSLASGYVHRSIPTINRCLQLMADKSGAFAVEFTQNPADLTAERLAGVDVLLFNNTTKIQKVFTSPEQRDIILGFIQRGGGFVAIHAATDAGAPQWPAYTQMVGGVFNGHPWNARDKSGICVEDCEHPVTQHFETPEHEIVDELYKYREYTRDDKRVLITVDTRVSPRPGKQRPDNDHALVWVKPYGDGRVFVSAFGHNESVCWDKRILQLWLSGIQFAAGQIDGDMASLPAPAWHEADVQ